jgi:hypothetical protein
MAETARPKYIFFNPDPMMMMYDPEMMDPAMMEDSSETGIPKSCTGRICNENFDVVHFKVSVILDTKAVADFIKELCSAKNHTFTGYWNKQPPQNFKHNQITVINYYSSPVNHEEPQHMLYRYGEDAVVQLDLTCEYLFVKEGYDPIKPESVKKLLNPQPAANPMMPDYGY